MPLEAVGTFRYDVRSKAGRVYVPAALVRDSQFPIEEGKVEIRVEGSSAQEETKEDAGRLAPLGGLQGFVEGVGESPRVGWRQWEEVTDLTVSEVFEVLIELIL